MLAATLGGCASLPQEMDPLPAAQLPRFDAMAFFTDALVGAEGPVTGELEGNRLYLHFTMKGGFPVEQWLTLSADGQRAYNVMKVRKMGITVAVMVEDIRRVH